MLPLSAPFKLRLTKEADYIRILHETRCQYHTCLITAPQKVFESPKQYMDNDNPTKPVMMTGLRPM
jgi:hypothetical protein